jgi:hypothetical protein
MYYIFATVIAFGFHFLMTVTYLGNFATLGDGLSGLKVAAS